MDLSITIVNTNRIDDTLRCIQSIYNNTHNITFEIYVVNNACIDNSTEIISKEFSQVSQINNEKFEGVAKNFNKGFKQSKGRYLLMLNEDCVVVDDCLEKMVEFLDENKTVGAATPKILNPDRSLQNQARKFPSLSTEFIKRFKIKAPFLKTRFADEYPDYVLKETFEPDWIGGTAIFFRKEVLDKVGLFDERFFVFYEDVDICKRIKQAGWRLIHFAQAEIIHKKVITKGKTTLPTIFKEELKYQLLESEFKYFKKHFGKHSTLILKCIIIFDITIQLIKSSLLYFFSYNSRITFPILLDWLKFAITY